MYPCNCTKCFAFVIVPKPNPGTTAISAPCTRQELAERLKEEEALRIKQDAKARLDKDQEQRMRDELGR